MAGFIGGTGRSLVAPALTRVMVAAVCVAMVAACDEPAVTEAPALAGAKIPSSANAARSGVTPVVEFGQNEHGSPFDPPLGHDHSTQAKDLMIPRTVVIPVGGQVTYQIDPFHRVNVYRAGTAPDDIDVTKLIDFVSGPVFIPNFVIDDPTNRIAQSPPFQFAIDQTWTTPLGTFNVPGRYLVMCSFLPHFADNDMYGWVIVR
jgi:hypothetical protein